VPQLLYPNIIYPKHFIPKTLFAQKNNVPKTLFAQNIIYPKHGCTNEPSKHSCEGMEGHAQKHTNPHLS
jgi:hypothetical protein